MPSPTYLLFRRAILARRQVVCTYRGRRRELCPHILGHTSGEEKVLAFQFGGESAKGLPPGGQWRCLALAEVEEADIRDGPWHEGRSHLRTQLCIEVVDVDVNVPRGRRLGGARKDPPASASKS
ncbi:MAG: hypothetical protein JO273_18240 [Methylobacteriaceae bacterium]|nr:hypothetical protein [Methylobacteriaceae bacterium]